MVANILAMNVHVILLVRNFKVGDAFVGYQKDTPAAVVFQVSHVLKDQVDIEDVEHWKAKVIVYVIVIIHGHEGFT